MDGIALLKQVSAIASNLDICQNSSFSRLLEIVTKVYIREAIALLREVSAIAWESVPCPYPNQKSNRH
jgi:hypothetical protein